jgi:CRISPR/Cas system-associated endonuclease Cas1
VIVAAARGFCVTSAAVRYCGARHIELLISDDVAAFVSLFAPEARGDARRAALKVRERQFRAAFNQTRTVAIARAIVTAKIKAEHHRQAAGKAFMTGLQKARTVDDVRHIEAQAAAIWWRQWDGFLMRFVGDDAERTSKSGEAPRSGSEASRTESPARRAGVPADWHSWPGRYIGRRQGRLGELGTQFTARGAIHPMQAMLNFSTAIVTARLTRAIVAIGLDPAFGFLHDGRKPGRLSLVWDAVEPLRPKLIKAMFGYAGSHEFERQDFLIFVHKVTAERTVRLTAGLAKEIATLTMKTVSIKECMKTTNWLVNVIKYATPPLRASIDLDLASSRKQGLSRIG